MANITISPNTYAGQIAAGYVSPAILSAPTLDKDLITIHENIKKREVIRTINLGDVIQPYNCNFTHKGTVTLGERYLDPIDLMVNVEFCNKDLNSTWEGAKAKAGANNTELSDEFMKAVSSLIQKQVARGMEWLIWQGDTSTSSGAVYTQFSSINAFDGLFKKVKAATNSVKVTGTTITSSNVLAELDKIIDVIPQSVEEEIAFNQGETSYLYVSYATLKAYHKALGSTYGLANSLFDITKKQSDMYRDVQLVSVGLAANKAIWSLKRNLHFGTDLSGDFMEYAVLPQKGTTGDKKIRISMDFTGDVNYTNDPEIVVYG